MNSGAMHVNRACFSMASRIALKDYKGLLIMVTILEHDFDCSVLLWYHEV